MALQMTTGFPRDLPTRDDGILPFKSVSFEPSYQNTRDPMRSGKVEVANIGVDLWLMEFASHALTAEDAMDLMSWLHSLRGGVRKFKAWHPMLEYPLAYPNGLGGLTRATGGTFNGTSPLTAIGVNLDTITLGQLPAGFMFKRSDMVSFPVGTSQSLHRVMEPATADGTGNATLSVVPPVPLAATASVTATMVKPWCLAVVDPASIRGPLEASDENYVQFSAIQSF